MPDNPNILFILTDQHHARAMRCAGTQEIETPNLDRIANEGVRFTNAFAVSAHCGPARVSLLTGLYEHTHRRHGNHEEPPDWFDNLTLPAALKKQDYQTAFIGKGHLGVDWPRRQFEYGRYSFMTDALPGDMFSCDYYRFLSEAGYADHFDDIEPALHLKGMRNGSKPVCHTAAIPLEYSVETWCGNETINFLRERDRTSPFCALMSFDRPHNPLSVPEPYDRMYNPEDIVLPENVVDEFKGKNERQQSAARGEMHYPQYPDSLYELKRMVAHYYGLVSLIDHQVGRVLDELEAQGILDNTIVVFTADHGDFAGEHGFMFKNLGLYDSVHRIPMLMRFPGGLPEGAVFDGIVEQVDIFPTLAELAGAEVPYTVEGRSFLAPLRQGQSDWAKEAALCEHVKNYHHISLRNRRYRLNYDLAGDSGTALYELYDYERDPGELVNCWNDPAYRDIRESLLCDLLRYRSSPPMLYGARLPQWKPTQCFYNDRGLQDRVDYSYKEKW